MTRVAHKHTGPPPTQPTTQPNHRSANAPTQAAQVDKRLSISDLKDRDLIELQKAFTAEALDEIRTLEGALIAVHRARHGAIPAWNKDPGRVPKRPVSPNDATLSTVVGRFDCLLQSRRTTRELAKDGEASIYEEHLHGVRLMAVTAALVNGLGFRNDMLRELLATTFSFFPGDRLLASDYLDHRNPLTVGPVLDPPPGDSGPSGL